MFIQPTERGQANRLKLDGKEAEAEAMKLGGPEL